MDETTFQIGRGTAFVAVLGLGVLLERAVPHARLRPSWRINLTLWATNAAVIGVVCGACACVVARWASQAGVGVLNLLAVPVWLAVPATILGLDVVSYGWHRANHRIPFLWRFHRVHHADPSFNVSTALRFHPGELLLSLPLRLAAVVALGAPVAGVLAFEVVFTWANVLEHGNFDLPRRAEDALARVLVTPALHRRHHSPERHELDSNFGTVFTLWDRLAGTFGPSSSARSYAAGLPGARPQAVPSLRAALLEPLR
jgi:sterol desaturase/sphingolipid hydroxylase (fatty acid hydroxylase superfamily)